MQTFKGIEYLMIDIANNFGLDKEDWDVRLEWVKTNESQLESMLKQADEPALYYAAIKAYRTAQRGEPVNYPISLDATSSGMQILACLTGDRKAAMLCNVLDAGCRMDAYQAIYRKMLKALGSKAVLAAKDVKQAVMTSLYGSQAVPREVFGEGSRELDQFYKTMEAEAPAVWELNNYFLEIWDSKAYSYNTILPDNFHSNIKVMADTEESVEFLGKKFQVIYKENKPVETGRALGANTTHSVDGLIVREMKRRCNYNPLRVDAVRRALRGEGSDYIVGSKEDDEMVEILWNLY
ncbi:MAG: DNA-directed RNA polymerase, partial [Bacteroides thetaiotaomicron]